MVAAVIVEARRRRRRARAAGTESPAGADPGVRDGLALAIAGLAIIVLPTLVFQYSGRYALPALPALCLAAGLAGQSLLTNRARRE